MDVETDETRREDFARANVLGLVQGGRRDKEMPPVLLNELYPVTGAAHQRTDFIVFPTWKTAN
mgnify:FL=1